MSEMSVPLLDLQAQYAPIQSQVIEAVTEVIRSKQFIMGPKVEEFESKIATYCGSRYALGLSSGTDALLLAMMAFDIGHGDEVITTPFTFFATAGCISRLGAKPVFSDILPGTFLIDPAQIEAKITPRTKAIIPVHLFGQMCDMDAIMDIANRHNLVVIEDAAQAIGSAYHSQTQGLKKAGNFGHIGCFSCFPSKNLGACGDAGFVTTNDEELAQKMRMLRVHGGEKRYFHRFVGGNFRLDPIQAAILTLKIPYLDEQHEGRRRNAARYNEALAGVVGTPEVDPKCHMIYNQYTIRTPHRDALQAHLNDRHVGNAIYYPLCMHLQDCFADLGYGEGDFPQAEKASHEVISLPVYGELTDAQFSYVVDSVLAGVRGAVPS